MIVKVKIRLDGRNEDFYVRDPEKIEFYRALEKAAGWSKYEIPSGSGRFRWQGIKVSKELNNDGSAY